MTNPKTGARCGLVARVTRLFAAMLDSTLRPVKDRLLAPVASGPFRRAPVGVITAAGLVASLAAALAAWQHWVAASVGLWLLGRVLDGLDGAVARATNRQSDVGGLLDFVADSIGYAAIPIGIAAALDERATWIATAVVLAAFYINAVSLGHIAALLEKRDRGAAASGAPTSVVLPRGLIEGTETIIVFTLALAVPSSAAMIWSLMAAAVAITVAERIRWATRLLAAGSTPRGAA